MLEAKLHPHNTFVTLTYNDEHNPKDGSLDPRHTQLFLKKCRKSGPLRYFLVGEYGDTTQRPHYHLALFGRPNCTFGLSRYSKTRRTCCDNCDNLARQWGMGHIYCGSLNDQTAAYIAGYVTKKLNAKHPDLGDRYPEFARMSLKPGIGYHAMHEIASLHLTYNVAENHGDVIPSIREGPAVRPLGRYLTRTLRHLTGNEKSAPTITLQRQAEKLRNLLKDSINPTAYDNPYKKNLTETEKLTFKNKILDKYQGRRASIETKQRIYKKRGTI